jgi:ABC-type nitrate/sulfonate/bicarbonate transport system permease component
VSEREDRRVEKPATTQIWHSELGSASRYLASLAGAIAFILIWEILARVNAVPYLPSFSQSVLALVQLALGGGLGFHTLNSIFRIGLGFGAAVVTGVPLGIAVGRWRLVHQFTKPVTEAVRFIPPLAMLPVALVILHTAQATAIFVIWFAAFFPILLGTVAGVHRTDPAHVEVAQSFGAREWQVLEKVIFPSALPEILTGARVGLGVGWMSLVAAEMVAAGGGWGLGYLIWTLFGSFEFNAMVGAIILLAVIGFLMNEGFVLFEAYVLRYRKLVTE